MHSSVLNYKIHHSILFPHEPLHPLPFKVFWSTCFVHNFSSSLDKFSPRSDKCVFLGFIISQKGYKCFSPSLNRYFVSTNVTFNKSSIYFKSSSHSTESPSNIVNIPMICDLLGVPCTPLVSAPPSLQVYSRRHRPQQPSSDSPQVPTNVSPPDPTIESPLPPSDLPIALRKGICSTCNPSPHYIVLNYHRLSSPFYTYLLSISSVTIPKFVRGVLTHPGWHEAMLDELSVLYNSETWELVPLLSKKFVVGCRWIFAIKVGPNGTIDCLKARPVAKSYTQIFKLDYGDNFSPVAKMACVRLFIAMEALQQ